MSLTMRIEGQLTFLWHLKMMELLISLASEYKEDALDMGEMRKGDEM